MPTQTVADPLPESVLTHCDGHDMRDGLETAVALARAHFPHARRVEVALQDDGETGETGVTVRAVLPEGEGAGVSECYAACLREWGAALSAGERLALSLHYSFE